MAGSNEPAVSGPCFVAPSLWGPGDNPGLPLTAEERAKLAVIATIARFRKGERIYKEGDRATAVFNIVTGVVKTYKVSDEHSHVVGFLFANDLFGLAVDSKYVNSAAAVTPVTAYRIPALALEVRLRNHPVLDFHFVARLCHELREAQRHAVLLSKKRAAARIGLFIQILESSQASQGIKTGEIFLPMTRHDIGAYAGISPEAVSRSFRDLVSCGAISVRDRRHIRIVDRGRLEAVISEIEPSRLQRLASVQQPAATG